MKINILEYFINTVINVPNKTAVIDAKSQINFSELDNKSRVLASEIIKLKNIRNKPIAVFLPKTIGSVIADIAITYTGNAYMNLDIKSPIERIKNILSLIKPEIIITDSSGEEQLSLVAGMVQIINIQRPRESDSIYTTEQLLERLGGIIDSDPYCLINTSGSTGTPKGVVLNHRSFIDFIEVSNQIFGFSDYEKIGSLSPLVFDIYSFELCMLMSKGSTLILIPDNLAAFPIKILEILLKQQVSFIFWVPTIMVNIANMDLFSTISLPDLQTIWFAGEVFPTKQFNYWKNKLPQALFANLYGPIEITLDCTYFIIDREFQDDEPLPIGKPYRNTDILILNENDELIKEGEEGELCVRGTSLAMGYYNDSEKTALAFVQNPLNKSYPEIIYRTGDIVAYNAKREIIFKGRKDTLIKHLGYRIELVEIEHAIVNVLQLAKNCCVVYNKDEKEIAAIYESSEDIENTFFRQSLLHYLPKYMVPTKFIRMSELPRNANGKIDRLTLKNLFIQNYNK